ncbi:response regulator transcription factor [Nakamurella endophytica]|uniref:DNA-binding response regulator n=1 Tax=Nakamurella endophytica TaxID=1748367 RepID=A0A917SWW3_9ACTN|nr:response regulator transcription factor [Nakamurella endophytica]GGM01726.1 DNA-binding response regulator [Nakamurella endophytica]
MTTVLLAEDDEAISGPLVRALRREGYDVLHATDGGGALSAATENPVSLVILDLGLPGMDGLEVCRRIRTAGRDTAVLMLTARTDEVDFVVGLDAGADDYVGKPFRTAELLARIRALLRRKPDLRLSAGGVTLDGRARRVTVQGRTVALSPKEFDLLQLLMSRADQVVSREEIVDALWAGDRAVLQGKTLDMHVSALRRKLAEDAGEPLDLRIATIRGAGLRFNP